MLETAEIVIIPRDSSADLCPLRKGHQNLKYVDLARSRDIFSRKLSMCFDAAKATEYIRLLHVCKIVSYSF